MTSPIFNETARVIIVEKGVVVDEGRVVYFDKKDNGCNKVTIRSLYRTPNEESIYGFFPGDAELLQPQGWRELFSDPFTGEPCFGLRDPLYHIESVS